MRNELLTTPRCRVRVLVCAGRRAHEQCGYRTERHVLGWAGQLAQDLRRERLRVRRGRTTVDAWSPMRYRSIVNVQQTFVPSMLHQENPAVILNTGSKQGITNPPCVSIALHGPSSPDLRPRGNAAYNASKAAVKSLTEGLAHELRGTPESNLTAHLLMYVSFSLLLLHAHLRRLSPGWVWTGMTGANSGAEKPQGAWTPQETVLYAVRSHKSPLSLLGMRRLTLFIASLTRCARASSISSARTTRPVARSTSSASCGLRATSQRAALRSADGTGTTSRSSRSISRTDCLSSTKRRPPGWPVAGGKITKRGKEKICMYF